MPSMMAAMTQSGVGDPLLIVGNGGVGLLNEYEEHRPHAGTGGSSKMRSRPSNIGGGGASSQGA